MAGISIPIETYAGRDEELGTWHLAHLDTEVMLRSEGVESIISGRRVQCSVKVKANAISYIEQWSDIPLVLCIQTEETELHVRGPLGVATCQIWVGILVSELVRSIIEEGLEIIVVPSTVSGLDEEVLHLIELVMSTEGDGVVAFVPREVVLCCPYVLVKVVGCTAEFSTDVDSVHGSTVTTGNATDLRSTQLRTSWSCCSCDSWSC